jgi:D-alanyl-D-alanine carboxypeptidase
LLSHTSGIHNYSDDPNFQNLKKLTRNRAEILDGLRNEGLDFTPGEQFRYSNSGYFLLGLIIEKVAGRSYESVLSHQIFAPLSMNATGYNHYETVLLGRASGYRAGPHGALENADYDDTNLPFAAGGLYSTVEDLERWNEALLEGTLLPPAVLAEMWTPVKEAYGYGWFLPAASAGTLHRRAVYHS